MKSANDILEKREDVDRTTPKEAKGWVEGMKVEGGGQEERVQANGGRGGADRGQLTRKVVDTSSHVMPAHGTEPEDRCEKNIRLTSESTFPQLRSDCAADDRKAGQIRGMKKVR